MHVSCLPTDRQSEGGQQAGIPLLEARVSGGRYHDRDEAAGDITIMVLQVRRRAREIPLRFPEGSIAP